MARRLPTWVKLLIVVGMGVFIASTLYLLLLPYSLYRHGEARTGVITELIRSETSSSRSGQVRFFYQVKGDDWQQPVRFYEERSVGDEVHLIVNPDDVSDYIEGQKKEGYLVLLSRSLGGPFYLFLMLGFWTWFGYQAIREGIKGK